MKKHILLLFAALALLCVLSACFPEPEFEPEPKEEAPEPYYCIVRLLGDDSDTIGISIGGGDYNKQPNRALTNEMAQAFHDFFEVVFVSNGVIARTTWNVGDTPELRGVRGKRDGDPAVNYATVRQPANNSVGSAVLFAGSKADKTLLAVGSLTSANGDGDTTFISNNTTEVIFTVTALTAGTGYTGLTSSFWTNYSGDIGAAGTAFYNYTVNGDANGIFIHYVDKKKFPCYRLRSASETPTTTTGSYTFRIMSGDFTTLYAGNNGAIVLAANADSYNYEVRQPRYILADGYYQTSSIFPPAVKQGGTATELALMTNNTSGMYFINPVTFTFNNANSPEGSIFALTFEIFVNNLTRAPTTLAGSTDAGPVKWRLSTGIGTKWLDLDNGREGEGGAILLGSGDTATFTTRLNAHNWQ